jgi:hypothetical protein
MTTRSGERSGRRPVYRVAGGPYGLGLLFGFLAALNGQLDLTASWLIAAYVLVGILIVFNLWFERWTRRVEDAVGDNVRAAAELPAAVRSRFPIYALAGMTTVTFLLVFDHRLRHAPRCHAVRIGDRGLLPGRRRHRRSTPRYRRPRKDRPQMTDASAVPCPPGRRCAGTESRLQHAHAGDGRQIGPSGLGCSLR